MWILFYMDNRLQHHDIFCHINEMGTITRLNIGKSYIQTDIPIYSLVYEEYTKINPSCIHYTESPIVITSLSESSLCFNKTFSHYRSNNKLKFKYNIILNDNSISITIQLMTETSYNYRYGMVIPVNTDVILYDDVKSNYNLVNFHRTWERKWADQTYVDAPIASFGNNNYSVCCPIDYNSQFFFHKQQENQCVRLSTSTHHSKQFNIVLMRHNGHVKESYVKHFPYADNYINFWKTTLKKIHKVHNIHLTYDLTSKNKPVTFDSLPYRSVSKTITSINEELSKYNISLGTIGLNEIVLCTNLKVNNKSMEGSNLRGTLVIDIRNFKKTLHHEIFHLLQQKDIQFYQTEWGILTHVPSIMKRDNIKEEMAETFANMMCNSYMTTLTLEEFPDLRKRCDIIEKIFVSIFNKTLKWELGHNIDVRRRQDADISIMNKKSLGVLFSKNKRQDYNNKISMLCGMDHSGVHLIEKYLKQTDITIIHDLNKLDRLYNTPVVYVKILKTVEEFMSLSNFLNCKVLSVIRNPQYLSTNNLEENFNLWINIYSAIMKF